MKRIPLVIVIVILSGFIGGCATDRSVMKKAEDLNGRIEPALIHDPELAGYIQHVGERIVRGADNYRSQPGAGHSEDRDWMFDGSMRFHLLNSDEVNAFTAGGRHVYVCTGLFQVVQSEDELAAVLAHEFAHVYGKHVRRTLNREHGIATLATAIGLAGSFYGVGDLSGGAAQVTAGFVGLRYSRTEEDEADQLGLEFHARAGWDPARFEDFFVRMMKQRRDKGPEILSSHPSMQRRAEAAGERASKLPQVSTATRLPPVIAAPEFKRLQDRSRRLRVAQPAPQE